VLPIQDPAVGLAVLADRRGAALADEADATNIDDASLVDGAAHAVDAEDGQVAVNVGRKGETRQKRWREQLIQSKARCWHPSSLPRRHTRGLLAERGWRTYGELRREFKDHYRARGPA